jgi:ATP-binding protein involved in chromosome partitioning
LFPAGQGEVFAAEVDIPYLGQIPFDPRLARTTDAGRPFILEHANTTAGRAITALAEQLEALI